MTATLPPATAASSGAHPGRTLLGAAWHERHASGLHVARVAGSDHEMGFQHGRLLRDAIPEGPLPYYRLYCERVLRRAGLGALAPVLMGAIRGVVARRIVGGFPASVRDHVRGLAEGAGLSEREAYEAFSMPDTLVWIATQAIKLSRTGSAERHRLASAFGCSSAVAWGPATADGRLYHARNFDYHGVAPWTRTQAVIFHAPEKGQRYVSVTAAGVPMGGVTAMNEAGLSLTVHQHMFSDATRLGGTPIGVAGDVVMREARSLDDAERILSRFTPIGCWTYVVCDGRRREAMIFEENPARRAARRSKMPEASTLHYANVYRDGPLGGCERDLYGSYWRANHGRDGRLAARLREGAGRLDAQGMAEILGDTGAPEGGCRVSRAIAMLLTVASVVFSPEEGIVWVGTGEAPTSHGAFVPFDLAGERAASERPVLQGGRGLSPEARESFEAYRRAYVAWFDHEDVGGARAHMSWAVQKAPREPLFHALEGLLALRALDARAAKEAFTRALALGHVDPERASEMRLWRGRASDLLGDRGAAVEDYKAALAGKFDPPVGKAAQEGIGRAYSRRKAARIAIDFAFADVIAP